MRSLLVAAFALVIGLGSVLLVMVWPRDTAAQLSRARERALRQAEQAYAMGKPGLGEAHEATAEQLLRRLEQKHGPS